MATTGIGTVVPVTDPMTKGDEVNVMFQLFDANNDGRVAVAELKAVLQGLDAKLWTDEKVNRVMDAYDQNGDGYLQFTEFWGWICGHGGRATDDFKPTLLERAMAEDRRRRALEKEHAERTNQQNAAQMQIAAEQARKEAERSHGERCSTKDYVRQQMEVGITKEVAMEFCRGGDEDHDGDIDAQERVWIAGDRAATTSQIKGLYQKCAGGTIDLKGNLVMKDVGDSGMQCIIQAFCSWDVNGDGMITADELARVLRTLNPKLGMKTVDALRSELDVDRNGSIDIMEFVGWLSGETSKKHKMKKKQKELQEAKLSVAMHRKRAEEARGMNLQHEFETNRHSSLANWCDRKKVTLACGKLYHGPGAPQICKSCGDRHAWLCHYCGFVSFSSDCVNGCAWGQYGWSCISGDCAKQKCGCKKKADVWHRTGNVCDLSTISLSIQKQLELPEGPC